jgi:hypothetical protein
MKEKLTFKLPALLEEKHAQKDLKTTFPAIIPTLMEFARKIILLNKDVRLIFFLIICHIQFHTKKKREKTKYFVDSSSFVHPDSNGKWWITYFRLH